MKFMYTPIIFLLSLFSLIQTQTWNPSSDTTSVVFDVDDVLAEPSIFQKPLLILSGSWEDPLNTHNWIASLLKIKNSYKRDENGKKEALRDMYGNNINGLSFHFLYHATQDSNLAQYVPMIVDTIEYSRTPIKGTIELCNYLKEKGFTLAFATNKDRPSYDSFARYIGAQVTDIPEIVFVAHTGNSDVVLDNIKAFARSDKAPDNYKQFARHALTVQPTEHIRHAPALKPETSYYEYVHTTMQNEYDKKHMIFIDDKQKNIDGCATYDSQTDNDTHVVGIPFKNPYQLVQELVKLGVFSQETDQEFLQKMKQYK